jgi:hypothetical protein
VWRRTRFPHHHTWLLHIYAGCEHTTDAKYAERCRLENYAFLGEALRGLAQKLPALQQRWQVCFNSLSLLTTCGLTNCVYHGSVAHHPALSQRRKPYGLLLYHSRLLGGGAAWASTEATCTAAALAGALRVQMSTCTCSQSQHTMDYHITYQLPLI